MSPGWVMTGLLTGVLLSPLLRAQMFLHSVPNGEPWRTRCQSCGHRILLIRWNARCASCGIRIGPPPGTVEVAAASVLALLFWRLDDPLTLAALAWTALVGVVAAFVDFAVHRLPDRLTFAAFGGAALIFAIANLAHFGSALLASAALTGLYLLLALANPAGMGLGDAKLALSVGLALGWFGWIAVIYGAAAGFVFSGCYAVAMLATGRLTRKDTIAHGPFMLLGCLATILLLA